ncbi:uncharacterized protein LOC142344988 [Convolutriloba macropyga]|uniref:uncharacterized protein LOC142344988 n=1 Tax=Convolutriloba macropyga TaxID=536237 RepID=UPI003F528941
MSCLRFAVSIFASFNVLVFSLSRYPLAFREIAFEKFIPNVRLLNISSILSFPRTENRLRCASLCLETVECISFNFCERVHRGCHLYKVDTFSFNATFEHMQSCTYSEMRLQFVPACNVNGSHADISSIETAQGKTCGMWGKTFQGQWTEWDLWALTGFENGLYIYERNRECHNAMRGGSCPGEGHKILPMNFGGK